MIFKAVKDIWDGTKEHATALVNLIHAIDRYQTAIQKNPQ